MTEKLYLKDSYLKELDANIIDRGEIDQQPAVVLDRTIFYPTSGGQMHDMGMLGDASVVNVISENDKIWHVLDKPVPGGSVHCTLDWTRRFDFMQQHTGFHILAQSFLRTAQAETLSSHLGEEFSTIDVQITQIDSKVLEETEILANRIVWEDRPIKVRFVTTEELAGLSLRKAPTVEGPIRLIDIEDFDLDPCGGTHVRRTGEVGLIKILSSERIRGYYRFSFVAGRRALREFSRRHRLLQEISDALSTGFDDLPAGIRKMQEEQKRLIKQVQKAMQEAAERSVQELVDEAKATSVIIRVFEGYDMPTLRKVASEVIKKSEAIFLLATEGESSAVAFASAKEAIDLRLAFDQIAPMIGAKGGGSRNFIQGGFSDGKRLPEALERARKFIMEKFG